MKDIPSVEEKDPSYFAYYGQFVHQQNMLSDYTRTMFYQKVTLDFAKESFQNKTVMDLGAGSGILSFFSCQVGAEKVYAIEASSMASKLNRFLSLQETKFPIQVIGDKIENIKEQFKVDTIISEPIGVLLVHERMLESFIYARDHFLKDGGHLFPTTGRILIAPFSDAQLWLDTFQKSQFWQHQNFFGADLSKYFEQAKSEYFSMPVVGCFPPQILLSQTSSSYLMDFNTLTIDQLQTLNWDLDWQMDYTAVLHGLAGWFDCEFSNIPFSRDKNHPKPPVKKSLILSTHPTKPMTHWQQIRFLFQDPLAVNAGDRIRGFFRMQTNAQRSYQIEAQIWIEDQEGNRRLKSERLGQWRLQDQTYHYAYQPPADPNLPQMPALPIMSEHYGLYPASE